VSLHRRLRNNFCYKLRAPMKAKAHVYWLFLLFIFVFVSCLIKCYVDKKIIKIKSGGSTDPQKLVSIYNFSCGQHFVWVMIMRVIDQHFFLDSSFKHLEKYDPHLNNFCINFQEIKTKTFSHNSRSEILNKLKSLINLQPAKHKTPVGSKNLILRREGR